jgi:hypothetical protein
VSWEGAARGCSCATIESAVENELVVVGVVNARPALDRTSAQVRATHYASKKDIIVVVELVHATI